MSLFNRLFRGKKSVNKENEHPAGLDREVAYRHSLRVSSSSRDDCKGERARFHEDIPATAPYHTVTAPRLHKGPMSCPGGYGDVHRNSAADRSFETEVQHNQERSDRDRRACMERRCRKQRTTWDTSEYGSGDPSPMTNYPKNIPYSEDIEESDDQEWNMHDKLVQLDNNCRRFMRKYKHAEERHMYYKAEWRKIYKAKEESENVFLRQIEQLTKQHDRDVERIRKLEAILAQYRYGHLAGTNPYNFAVPLSSHSQNTSSLMPSLPPLPNSTATPSTSAVESVTGADMAPLYTSIRHMAGNSPHSWPPWCGQLPAMWQMDVCSGALSGEALTERADLSMMRPLHFNPSFTHPVMDDVDETKNFRALAVDDSESFLSGLEAPRDNQVEKTLNPTAEEDVVLHDSSGTTSDCSGMSIEHSSCKKSNSIASLEGMTSMPVTSMPSERV